MVLRSGYADGFDRDARELYDAIGAQTNAARKFFALSQTSSWSLTTMASCPIRRSR